MTPIADMVAQMLADGVPHSAIVLAVRTAEIAAQAFRWNSGGISGGIPVDEVAEKRRAYDRERKRNSGGIPVESGGIPPEIPNRHMLKKERKKERRGSLRSPMHALPADFVLTESDNRYAADRGWSASKIATELERFRDHALARNRTQANWHAAWRNWVSSPYQQTNGNGGFHAANPSGKNVSDVAREMFAEISRREGDDPDGVLPQD